MNELTACDFVMIDDLSLPAVAGVQQSFVHITDSERTISGRLRTDHTRVLREWRVTLRGVPGDMVPVVLQKVQQPIEPLGTVLAPKYATIFEDAAWVEARLESITRRPKLRGVMDLGRSDMLITLREIGPELVEDIAVPEPGPDPDPDPDPEPPENDLLGVGSESTSYDEYPPTGPVTVGDMFVATDGNDSNPGTLGSPKLTIAAAINAASTGQTILVRGGTYPITTSLRPKAGQKIYGFGEERPVLSRGAFVSGASNNYIFYVVNDNVHVKGFEFVGGIDNTGNSHSSLVARVNEASSVVFEDIVSHSGQTGAIMFYNTTDCMALDCISFGCAGAGSGTNLPDGFMGSGTVGVMNNNLRFIRCLSANVGDDATDFYYANDSLVLDCVAIATNYAPVNGANLGGDGNGFKMGGASGGGPNHVRGSIAVHCRGQGLNHNSTPTPGNTYVNNTSTLNNIGVISDSGSAPATTTRNIVVDNNSRNGEVNVGGPTSYNTWNLGISDPLFADPANGDFSLLPGSAAIGAGPNGENLGASEVALALLKKWWNHSLIWVPGRGAGPGGTGLPGDTP